MASNQLSVKLPSSWISVDTTINPPTIHPPAAGELLDKYIRKRGSSEVRH